MNGSPRDASLLALALLSMDGVGRVSTGRLVDRFGSYDRMLETPREQVIARLPGIPRAGETVARLFEPSFRDVLAEGERQLDELAARRIHVLTSRHADWPARANDLPRGERPVVLFAFGDTSILQKPLVAFLARPPLEGEAFERAQTLLRRVMGEGIVPVVGLQHGFDVVACKIADGAGKPAVALASAGLARVPGPMRPAGAALARAGGVLVSPFPLDHGPFAHDDVERARLAAAISSATVFVGGPEGSAERRAAEWVAAERRALFTTQDVGMAAARSVGDESGYEEVVARALEAP